MTLKVYEDVFTIFFRANSINHSGIHIKLCYVISSHKQGQDLILQIVCPNELVDSASISVTITFCVTVSATVLDAEIPVHL